jgi:arabinose-5-phosphate isomerase
MIFNIASFKIKLRKSNKLMQDFLIPLAFPLISPMNKRVKLIFEREAAAISNIPAGDNYDEITEIIHKNVHERDGKLITSGMGKAGQIAHNIATTFSSTGTPAVFLHPSEAQHGDLGIIQRNDVLLAISNSGKTREIVELIELKNKLHPSIPVIVITGNINSPLARKADIFISTGSPAEVCPLGLTPTTSTTVFTAIGDALVVLMMEKIGFSAEEYAKRHHGGYLGMKSRRESAKTKTK